MVQGKIVVRIKIATLRLEKHCGLGSSDYVKVVMVTIINAVKGLGMIVVMVKGGCKRFPND